MHEPVSLRRARDAISVHGIASKLWFKSHLINVITIAELAVGAVDVTPVNVIHVTGTMMRYRLHSH